MQQQTYTQQPTPASSSIPQQDPLMVSAAISILFPLMVVVMVSGYRRRRVERFKQQVARLERLWHLSPKK
jgi:hypothetical protein